MKTLILLKFNYNPHTCHEGTLNIIILKLLYILMATYSYYFLTIYLMSDFQNIYEMWVVVSTEEALKSWILQI